jgi:hypothetical protein
MTFTHAGEAVLSEWMAENALVTWLQVDEPWLVEDEALSALELPLNLDGSGSSFRPTLRGARDAARAHARLLPVVPR